MPVAILDFGTNTFNLLIAEKHGKSFRVLYDGKQGVKLGKGGINNKQITPEAMERGLLAISKHMETIESFGVSEIHAYATSAMRNAENGTEFASMIRERFGFSTNIISGEEEAALIYEGIMESVDLEDKTGMILDIGGGSNEFIICNKDEILWKHSFELGMARIIDRFGISDPIKASESEEIEAYYKAELELLLENVAKYTPEILIGASGSFDTIAALIQNTFGAKAGKGTSFMINEEYFEVIHETLLASTTEERMNMKGMEAVRVEMIVPATIFINFVYRACGLQQIIQSPYALKEGVMARLARETGSAG